MQIRSDSICHGTRPADGNGRTRRGRQEEADRGRPAARRDQQGVEAREVDPARAPEHAAPVVGAAAAGGGAGRDLRADGRRPVRQPDLFKTERAQERERQRLFRIIEQLVLWENTTNEVVLEQAREEIWQSWRRACAENADHPRAKELFDRHVLPAFHDPFAGGGSLPLEAQRLGLEAHASDLNPVAVLINKAMIEIPPKFAGKPPVNQEAQGEERLMDQTWRGAQGLAEDVRHYGRWMRDEAEKRIGHLYPRVPVTEEMAQDRPDLEKYVGHELTVIAWLWARTVKSPNPAFADVHVPLASSFILSKKGGREAYVEPLVSENGYRFTIKVGTTPESAAQGTTAGKRSAFRCLMSGVPVPYDHIRTEGQAGRMDVRLMAIVAEGERGRVYLPTTARHEEVASEADPNWRPGTALPCQPSRLQDPELWDNNLRRPLH